MVERLMYRGTLPSCWIIPEPRCSERILYDFCRGQPVLFRTRGIECTVLSEFSLPCYQVNGDVYEEKKSSIVERVKILSM